MRAWVIFNPAARGERAAVLRKRLPRLEKEWSLKPTTGPRMARALAAEAVRQGVETIVAVGGDGTINEVVNGIGDVPEGFERVRLGMVPIGTVNVFAMELGIPFQIERAWEVVRRGKVTQIDLPRAEFVGADGPESRFFVQLAGAGLDALAVREVRWELKKRIGYLAYVVAGIKAMRSELPRIEVAEGALREAGEVVLIGNGRYYGGKVLVFEEADLRDGRMDICVVPRATWISVLRYAWALLVGKVPARGKERHFNAARLTLEADGEAHLQLDGEWVGRLPATLTLCPMALRVIVP